MPYFLIKHFHLLFLQIVYYSFEKNFSLNHLVQLVVDHSMNPYFHYQVYHLLQMECLLFHKYFQRQQLLFFLFQYQHLPFYQILYHFQQYMLFSLMYILLHHLQLLLQYNHLYFLLIQVSNYFHHKQNHLMHILFYHLNRYL